MTPPEDLADADAALLATAATLDHEALAVPSLLPGWSRAHVLAHVVLNAEALTGVLTSATAGVVRPMYPSQTRRDSDIHDLAARVLLPGPAASTVLRERLEDSCRAFAAAWSATPEPVADVVFERTPGSGPMRTVGALGAMRLDEVQIHHGDLGCAFGPGDWTASYACGLLDRIAARPGGPRLVARAVDADRSWTLGDGGPVVTGPAAWLAWWLTGRDPAGGAGSGRLEDVLTVEGGDLPQIGAW